MAKTEYDLLDELLASKDEKYALAYLATYAHAKALGAAPIQTTSNADRASNADNCIAAEISVADYDYLAKVFENLKSVL